MALRVSEPRESSRRSAITHALTGLEEGDDFDSLMKQGAQQYEAKDYAAAEESYLKATRINPEYGPAWFYLAAVRDLQDKFEKAETAYRRAIELDFRKLAAWSGLGSVLKQQGKFSEAANAYRKVTELDPWEADGWIYLADVLNRWGKFSEAEAAARKATGLAPNDSSGWVHLGFALRGRGEYVPAKEAFETAIQKDSEDTDAWNGLGYVLNDLKEYVLAQAAFKEVFRREPKNPTAWRGLGDALHGLGKNAEAFRAHLRAQGVNPDDAGSAADSGQTGLEEAKRQAERMGIIASGLKDARGLPLGLALSRVRDGAGRFLPVAYIARSAGEAAGLEELGADRASILVLGPDLSLKAALTAAEDRLRLTAGVRRVVRLGVDQKIPGILEWLIQHLPGIELSPQMAGGLEEWVDGAVRLLGNV